MTSEAIAKALGGRRSGGTWMARCPAHDDASPSLSISASSDGKVLVCCHAGCNQREVIAALSERGLWGRGSRNPEHNAHRRFNDRAAQSALDVAARTELALSIWRSSSDIAGSLAETYLSSRAIKLPPSSSLRFHPGLKQLSGGIWPAMVALVVNGETGAPIAIHRTFLDRDGKGKAPVDPPKMMLGPCRGGVVRLSEPGQVLMVGEGIETCLAAMQLFGKPAWSALSTSGLRSLDLPSTIGEVIVLADGDEAGEAAAQDCAKRWHLQGRCVRIARPPDEMDFNDLLEARNAVLPEGHQ